MWICKKHGENCKTYVKGIVDLLDLSGLSKEQLDLVEWQEKDND